MPPSPASDARVRSMSSSVTISTVTVTATDAAGNQSRTTEKITLKR